MTRFTTEPDFAAQEMQKAQDRFNECDANGDGRLDLEEWINFCRKSNEAAVARGLYNDDREETWRANYAIFNDFNPEADGFSYAEMQGIWAVWMAKYQGMKAEMGLE